MTYDSYGRMTALDDTTVTSDPFIVQQRYDYDPDGNLWLEYSRELDSFEDPGYNIFDQTRSYHSIDGKLSVVNRHMGISGVSDESHSGRHQVYQENWYDALGRRVMVRARKSSACNNGIHGDLACKSYVERTVWDGDQILVENRINGASGLSSDALDYSGGGSSSGAWGQVLSVHAHGIDQPVVVRKLGATSIAPHANWMGDYEIGTTANGTVTTSCNGASNCPLILWPGSKQTVDGQLVSHSAINTWWGTLITEKTDPSGYKYMRNRYYNPQTGQFTQTDPIGLAGGLNLYGFADGDLVNFGDPFGLCPVWISLTLGSSFTAGSRRSATRAAIICGILGWTLGPHS
jgi:RHS repeat-associated protein